MTGPWWRTRIKLIFWADRRIRPLILADRRIYIPLFTPLFSLLSSRGCITRACFALHARSVDGETYPSPVPFFLALSRWEWLSCGEVTHSSSWWKKGRWHVVTGWKNWQLFLKPAHLTLWIRSSRLFPLITSNYILNTSKTFGSLKANSGSSNHVIHWIDRCLVYSKIKRLWRNSFLFACGLTAATIRTAQLLNLKRPRTIHN